MTARGPFLESIVGILITLLAMALVASCQSVPVAAMDVDIECLDTRSGKRWAYRVEDVQSVKVGPDGHHQVEVIDSTGRRRVIDSGDWQLLCDGVQTGEGDHAEEK